MVLANTYLVYEKMKTDENLSLVILISYVYNDKMALRSMPLISEPRRYFD